MGGRVLLDTNIVIGVLAKDEAIFSRLVQTDAVFLPVVVLGELYYGAAGSGHSTKNRERIDQLGGTDSVLPCDGTSAAHYGQIKAALRAKGRPIPENDIWIGGPASQHNLTVIPRDVHFREITGLPVEAW